MQSEYLDPEQDQDKDQNDKVQRESNTSSSSNQEENKSGEKKDFPNKDQDFKVLNEDGSLADLPYNNQPGGGPNEGTVGIGT
jgi:hypothetical protein